MRLEGQGLQRRLPWPASRSVCGVREASQRSASVHGDGARGRSRGESKALFKERNRVQDQDEDFFDQYKNARVK